MLNLNFLLNEKRINTKPDEVPQSIASQKEAIFQHLRDLGTNITDVTKEMGATTSIIVFNKPS